MGREFSPLPIIIPLYEMMKTCHILPGKSLARIIQVGWHHLCHLIKGERTSPFLSLISSITSLDFSSTSIIFLISLVKIVNQALDKVELVPIQKNPGVKPH
jgi:hypothetical protein